MKQTPPFIFEEEGTRSLHFGTELAVQSQMRMDVPGHLVLDYTRIMIGFLLFIDRPEHIGMVGLGGGSIQKHCYRRPPGAQISVAEINPEVIAVRDSLFIPNDDHRFKVFLEDGAAFVKRHPNHFDVLVVDGFDVQGQPPKLCSREFYDDCYRALRSNGVIVVNFCESLPRTSIWRLRRSFGDQVLAVDTEDSTNTVVFAGKGNCWSRSAEELWQRQAHIGRNHSINLKPAVRELLAEREARHMHRTERSRQLCQEI